MCSESKNDVDFASLPTWIVLPFCSYTKRNIIFSFYIISGYNDKQETLLNKLINKMVTFEVDPKRYEIIKEKYKRALVNFKVAYWSRLSYFEWLMRMKPHMVMMKLLRKSKTTIKDFGS